MPSIISYFNPFSNEFNSTNEFATLSKPHQALIGIVTAFASLISIGTLGVPVFRLLVGRFKQMEMHQLTPPVKKINEIAVQNLLQGKTPDSLSSKSQHTTPSLKQDAPVSAPVQSIPSKPNQTTELKQDAPVSAPVQSIPSKPNQTTELIDESALQLIIQVKEQLAKEEHNPLVQLKHFCMGVLDSVEHKVVIGNLDGLSHTQALYWYIQHLKLFQTQIVSNSKFNEDDKKQLNSLIQQFEFALDMDILIVSYLMEFMKKFNLTAQKFPAIKDLRELCLLCKDEFKSFSKKAFIESVIKRIHELKTGERVILLGGTYNMAGHAVLYSIYKNINEQFIFQIINTGEGVDIHMPYRERLKNVALNLVGVIKYMLTNNLANLEMGKRITIRDREYHNIRREEFSEAFINALIDVESLSDKMTNMNHFFDNAFGLENLKPGRTHKAQKKGSCAHKSLSAGAKAFLPKQLYLEFKAYMTAMEIQHNKARFQKGEYKVIFQNMDFVFHEADRILEKRRKKAALLLPSTV